MDAKLAKLNTTSQADEAINRMLHKSNKDWDQGRINKTELLSWLVLYFEAHCFDKVLSKMRDDHFDEVAYLRSLLTQLKRTQSGGTSQQELKEAISRLRMATRKTQTASESVAATSPKDEIVTEGEGQQQVSGAKIKRTG